MKVLSLWQPWGTFMLRGWKKNETRSWSTSYRGLLVIQAAKNKSSIGDADDILEAAGIDIGDRTTGGATDWHLGMALCVVELVDCVRTEKIRDGLIQRELAMGDYSDGRFAWITENVRPLKPFIPVRGAQGLFEASDDLVARIMDQYPNLSCSVAGSTQKNDLFA